MKKGKTNLEWMYGVVHVKRLDLFRTSAGQNPFSLETQMYEVNEAEPGNNIFLLQLHPSSPHKLSDLSAYLEHDRRR
jgi:hypothetical protein